jgi:hypothetical protein
VTITAGTILAERRQEAHRTLPSRSSARKIAVFAASYGWRANHRRNGEDTSRMSSSFMQSSRGE